MASVNKREGYGFEVRYVDPKTGKRPSKTFKTKKAADAFKRKVEREIEDGAHTAEGDSKPMAKVVDEFLDYTERRLQDGRISENYVHAIKMACRCHIRPDLGKIMMNDLTQVVVERFYNGMRDKGNSPRTCRDRLNTLLLVEKFGKKHGYCNGGATTAAIMDLSGTPRSIIATFQADEVSRLLAVAEEDLEGQSFRFRDMLRLSVHLAAFCGMRWGEIFGLQVERINLAGQVITVRHSLNAWDNLKATKTAAGVRTVPLPQHIAKMLKQWMETHYIENDRGLLFRSLNGTMVAQANFHTSWNRLLTRAGLPTRHFHALRHFCASWMIENHLPVTDVATILGHAKFDMTLQTYAHPVVKPAARVQIIEAMVSAMPLSDARVTQRLING